MTALFGQGFDSPQLHRLKARKHFLRAFIYGKIIILSYLFILDNYSNTFCI